MQDLLAAESQQLPGQSRGALSGLVDLFQAVPQRIARLQAAEQQPAVAVDHGQQVVEVVRHPTRQPSDALQFLSLAQLIFYLGLLGFRAFQSGDVPACAHNVAHFSARIRNQFRNGFRGYGCAVFAEKLYFIRLDARALVARFHGGSATFDLGDGHPVSIVRHRPVHGLSHDLFG